MNNRESIEYARANVVSGIIEEPRILFDQVDLNDVTTGKIIKGTPDTLVNGEAFPLRITHIVVTQRPFYVGASPTSLIDPRTLQRIALRFQFHDQKYLSDSFVPAPLWSNVAVAGSSADNSQITWHFDRPWILGVRDALLLSGPSDQSNENGGTVTLHGVGLESQRPYIFQTTMVETEDARPGLWTAGRDFRNDGSEPIIITDLTFQFGSMINIKQIGHGTNANWFRGPQGPDPAPTLPFIPSGLLALTQGRSIVHELPEPWLWQPADGCLLESIVLEDAPQCGNVVVGLVGTLMVT